MSCCPPLLIPFSNKAFVIVPYGPFLQEQYGIGPNVSASFFVPGLNINVIIKPDSKVINNTIEVDFGDVLTGFIKIS